ncbi:unnamed protein product [Closterium sp. NIES-64]|nr:unnamed protein product [Closterium sp. NIES-64]
MAQPGNAAAARVSPLTQQQQLQQQQQHSFDRRDRRAQSLESQRKRHRASGFDLDASSESRAAKSARTGACASSQPSSSSIRPSSSQSSPSSSFPSASLSSRATEIFGTPTGRLEDYFVLESAVLGSGQFGTVRRCVEKATGARFACKSILKSRLTSESERHDVRREVVLMQRLAAGASCGATSGAAGAASATGAGVAPAGYSPHAGVVQLRAVFEDDAAVHMIMELCDGGELFDEIVRRGRLSERDAAQVFSQIVSAVAFCHSRGVLHRDLKPENILLARYPASAATPAAAGTPSAGVSPAAAAGAGQRVVVAKLADLGLAIPLKQGERARGVAGSPFYIAPEVLRGDYSFEADVWSLGVILYILLCGAPPFWGPTDRDVFMKVLQGAVDMGGEEWRGVSEEAKGLVRCLLQRDPRKRPPAGKIMTHPWILLNCLGGRILRQQLAKKPTAAGAPASAAVAGAGASAHAPLPHHYSSPAFQPDSSA